MAKDKQPAKQKDITELIKKQNAFKEDLNAIDKSFSNMSTEVKEYVANAGTVVDGVGNFLTMQRDSLAGFNKELTASFRATRNWADRIKFDINSLADENIRDVNEQISQFGDMQSETGKFMEKRLAALMEELRDADQEKTQSIFAEMHAMRDQGMKQLSKEEADRFDFMSKTAMRGLDSLTSKTSILKGAITESLGSIDKFAEGLLGGGILGKFVGATIRRRKAHKEAQASMAGQLQMTGQQDVATAGGKAFAGSRFTQGEGHEGSQAKAFDMGFKAVVAELREQNQNFKELIGLEHKSTNAVLDQKEDAAEQRRINERRHDELIDAQGEGGGGGDADPCPRIPGGFMNAVLAALSGKWVAQAANFLMTPLKKVVGAVAGGIGKAVGFIMPKKWSAGLSKFFKSTDKAQSSALSMSDRRTNFLKKITDKLKGIFQSILKTIKNIFNGVKDVVSSIIKTIGKVLKSIGDVINSVMKSLGKILKTIGKGIADFMGMLAKGISHFGKPQALIGALALTIVAAGIFIFAKAMGEFTKVSWKAVGVAAVSMLVLVGSLTALGALMMSGVGAVALLLGAVALVVVAGAMWILGKAMQEFAGAVDKAIPFFELLGTIIVDSITAVGDAIATVVSAIAGGLVEVITTITDTFERLSSPAVGPGLFLTAGGIIAVTAALAGFMAVGAGGAVLGAAANVVAGVGNWVAGWFGQEKAPSAMEILGALASFPVQDLLEAPKAIDGMIGALNRFAAVEIDGDQARETIGVIASLGGALKAFQVNEPGLLGTIGGFLGGAMKKATGWLGSLLGIEQKEKKDPLQLLEEIVAFVPQLVSAAAPLQRFSNALLSIMQVLTSSSKGVSLYWLTKAMKDIAYARRYEGLDGAIKSLDKLGDAFDKLSDALFKMEQVDVDQVGYVLQRLTDMNQDIKDTRTARQMLQQETLIGRLGLLGDDSKKPQGNMIRTSNVVNNTQTFAMPINPRNNESSLNDLLARRR